MLILPEVTHVQVITEACDTAQPTAVVANKASASVPVIVSNVPTAKALMSLVAHISVADKASGVTVNLIVSEAACIAVVILPIIDTIPIEPVQENKSPDVKLLVEVLVANFVPGRMRSVFASIPSTKSSIISRAALTDSPCPAPAVPA